MKIMESRFWKIALSKWLSEIKSFHPGGSSDDWKRRNVPTEDTYDNIAVKENIVELTNNPDSLLKIPNGISVMFA